MEISTQERTLDPNNTKHPKCIGKDINDQSESIFSVLIDDIVFYLFVNHLYFYIPWLLFVCKKWKNIIETRKIGINYYQSIVFTLSICSINMTKWLFSQKLKRYHFEKNPRFILSAIDVGNKEYVDFLIKENFYYSHTTLVHCIKSGRNDILEILYLIPIKGCAYSSVTKTAIQYSNIEALNILKKLHCLTESDDISRFIISKNDVTILEWFYKNTKNTITSSLMRNAAQEGKIESLMCLLNTFGYDDIDTNLDLLFEAISEGRTNIMELFYHNSHIIDFKSITIEEINNLYMCAIKSGFTTCLQWLKDHNLEYSPDFYDSLFDIALKGINVDVLNWLVNTKQI